MSEWINLKKIKPKDGEKVLIFTNKKSMAVGYFIFNDSEIIGVSFDGTATSLSMWELRGMKPTHWMPLPEPPK